LLNSIQNSFKSCCRSHLSMEDAVFHMLGAAALLAKVSGERKFQSPESSSINTLEATSAFLLHVVTDLQGILYRKLHVLLRHQSEFGEDGLRWDADKEKMLQGNVRSLIPHIAPGNSRQEYLVYTMTQLMGYYEKKRKLLTAFAPGHAPSASPWMTESEEVWRSPIDNRKSRTEAPVVD